MHSPLHQHVKRFITDERIPILLLQHGASVNALDSKRRTPLHAAFREYGMTFDKNHSVRLIQALLFYGAHLKFVEDMRVELPRYWHEEIRTCIIFHMLSHDYNPSFLMHVDPSNFSMPTKLEIVQRVRDVYSRRAVSTLGLPISAPDIVKSILDKSFPVLKCVEQWLEEPILIE